ncbi:MAG TPA: hypothetical protein EYQ86_02565, partial [Bacteroidetes bacterium]|nr:hypothetical protein [Bacteroidota bacterium]
VLFDSIKTKVNYLGVEIIAHDSLKFDQDQFKFENFKVFDAKRTQAYINGRIEHNLFTDFKFDSLRLNPKGEFIILNTTEDDNALYYGKGVIRKKMKNLETLAGIIVDGPLNEPYLDFKASSNEGTKIVIPISEEEDFSDQSFVRFKKEKSLNSESGSSGSKRKTSIIFNGDLEINEKSELEIQLGVPDGDIIKVNGRGNLQLDYNETQDFNIYGNYEIESGEYIFNFQDIVKKKFSLVEGSIISWTGDPYAGTMNLKASYRIRTNIASLLQETSFQAEELNLVRSTVLVIMKGSLMSPDIKFSIVIDEPQYASLVNPVIKRIESDEQELNKQVFSLLILNRFANLFNKSTISAKTSPLYNNLSEFLSTQLQELVSSSGSEFLSSVDLGVELASYEQGGVDENDEYSAQKK